ncbi:MAG TPA: hypothetical protein VFD67_15240 [Gemmatimonadaceae bacterium]|nr:hypothetical protein [Gemmatimonadaceae bacterium]
MRVPRIFAVILASLTLGACETSTSPASQPLSVSADGTALTLRNPNAWPVFYLAMDPRMLAVAELALCRDPSSSCPRVAAFGTVRLPYSEISGYQSDETQARVMHWRLHRQMSGDYEATDIQSVDVSLR